VLFTRAEQFMIRSPAEVPMMNRLKRPVLLPLALPALVLALLVQPHAARADDPPKEQPKENPADLTPQDRVSVTEHEVMLAGAALKYRASAGTLAMRGDDGKPKAAIFFVAYEKLPAPDNPKDRPITFVFNGGPGAAAVWLHLGTVGPRRVKLNEEGDAPAPPNEIVDNEHTWLDSTDLVFIDPIGTGYSRPAPGEDRNQFFGVREDVNWVGSFIRLYLTRYQRWASPKFMAGESYGTTRAAALSEHLIDRHGIALNGVMLISSVLDFQTISFGKGNDLPYALFLPTYTAGAWYHKKLPPDLQDAGLERALAEAEAYALQEYPSVLMQGHDLPTERRAAAIQKLARLTGLPPDLIDKADLRIDGGLFRERLLGDTRKVVGRFDCRLTGFDTDPLSRDGGFDPSLSQYLGAYSTAFNAYARRELKYETDLSYEVLTGSVHPWNFGGGGNSGYLRVADDLNNAMVKNPQMRVLFASGYYDMATPYLGAKYTVNHLDLSPELRANITETFYTGGHMMYHQRESLRKLDADVDAFVRQAVAAGATKDAAATVAPK
jgi:carboxypeptidase C (cathepsin A)